MLVDGNPSWRGSPIDRGTGGGDNGGMDARLAALEARLDAVLPTLATKSDVANLRADFHRELGGQTWRIIGTMLTAGALLTAAIYFIARSVN